MSGQTDSHSGGVNIHDSTVTVRGDIVGGDKTINIANVTVAQYVSGQLPPEVQLAFFGSEIGMRSIRAVKFASAQFEAYSNTWKRLAALSLAADELWASASPDTLAIFAAQLRQTQLTVQEGELYFEEADRAELLRVMNKLGDYRIGKEHLVELYARLERRRELQYVSEEIRREWDDSAQDITNQLRANGTYRLEYQRLLERIRLAFRQRLAN